MRALVTGAAGFLGSHLVERLVAEDLEVDAVDDLSSGSLAHLAAARAQPDHRLRFHRLDATDASLAELCAHRRPEVVVHLARNRGPAPRVEASFDDPVGDLRHTLVTAASVADAARRAGATKVVTVVSGAARYAGLAGTDLPARESPVPPYASPHAAAIEALVQHLGVQRDLLGLEFTVLALASVYGPRQRHGVVPSMVAAVEADRPVVLEGGPETTRDLLFVDDAVDAVARATSRGGGLVINVSSGDETRLGDLARRVAEACGRRGAGVEVAPARAGEPSRLRLDRARASMQLGWQPWTSLDEGLAATVAWWRAAGGHAS